MFSWGAIRGRCVGWRYGGREGALPPGGCGSSSPGSQAWDPVPAHLGILYPPSLCSSLRIMSQLVFQVFLRSSADGTVWSKNTEALPVPGWPLWGTATRTGYREKVGLCCGPCFPLLSELCSQRSSALPSSSSGESCVLGDWQKIQKRRKCGKIAAGLIMEGGMREIQ